MGRPEETRVIRARELRAPQLNGLTTEQRKRFIPLCPDFVIELRSPTDNISALQERMQEYIANGAGMGLLLDTEQRRVYIYKADEQVQAVENPEKIICGSVLSGFELNLLEIW